MTDKSLVPKQGDSRISAWGDRDEVREIARRVQLMAPGGHKLGQNEALALAQGAVAHGLDPFNGEIWYIPGSGLMAGIKGHRKAARKQVANFWPEFEQITDPDARRLLMIPDGALAFRCVLRDSATILAYAEMWKALAENGVPVETIPTVIGKRPYTEGIGYLKFGEKTKMDPVQCAMKRAEADALKRRFDLPFVAPTGDMEIIDADWSEDAAPKEAAKPTPEETAETVSKGKEASSALYSPEATRESWVNHLGPEDEAWLVEKRIIPPGQDPKHTIGLMSLSPFKPGENWKTERGLLWFRTYRGGRDQDLSPLAAATNANAAIA